MVEKQSESESASLAGAAEALGPLSPLAVWDAVWRPRHGVLEARYFGETPEGAAREFAEEAARLRSVGYRPSSASWSAPRATRWRAPWRRKHGEAYLVVTYRALDDTLTRTSG